MLYREIIAVCSQIHTKHKNTLCGQNVGLLTVKTGGTQAYSNNTIWRGDQHYNVRGAPSHQLSAILIPKLKL